MNEIAEFINYLSANVDDFGYAEKHPTIANSIIVRGGSYMFNSTSFTLSDTNLTMPSDTGNWDVFLVASSRSLVVQSSGAPPTNGYPLCRVYSSGGVITNITDSRAIPLGVACSSPLEGHIIQDSTTTYPYRPNLKFA